MRSLAVLLLTACSLAGAAERGAGPLGEYHWRNRVLLLYAPDRGDPTIDSFRERLERRRCGVADRDLVTGVVAGATGGRLDGAPLAPARARALRRWHDIAPARVATVLVGKDGGTKAVVDGVADVDDVFARIDAMPMRRREMAEGGAPGCSGQGRGPGGQTVSRVASPN